MAPLRPETPSSGSIRSRDHEPWELQAELARYRAIMLYMSKSGKLAITSPQHQVYRGALEALHKSGFDCSILISVFDSVAAQSPDLRGISRKEIDQLLAPPKIIIPGAGTLGEPITEKPGLITRMINTIRGTGEDQ
jgi:hypothetical protein